MNVWYLSQIMSLLYAAIYRQLRFVLIPKDKDDLQYMASTVENYENQRLIMNIVNTKGIGIKGISIEKGYGMEAN